MYHFLDFTGKKIVVAGASSGIGRQTAITLSRLGAQVILIARRQAQLEETKALLEGEGHACYVADLSVNESIAPLVKEIVAQHGKLDGLVYAAGISQSVPLAQSTYERYVDTFNINYFGFAELVRQITRKGRFNEGMRIVGISSTASSFGDKSQDIYAGTKAAMDGTVRCMAKELAEKGICINTIQPGFVDTPMMQDFFDKVYPGVDKSFVYYRQYLGFCAPEDIANAAAFLLSPAARMITGTSLHVDGGAVSN